MSKLGSILKSLKAQGCRFTKARKVILELLVKSPKPLSAVEIKKAFLARETPVNKTTIYRELAFLESKGVICKLQLGDNIMRYEIVADNHHHHTVCLNCKEVKDVVLEKDLDKAEKIIARTKNFKVLYYSLEFYGVCERCLEG